MSSYHLSAFQRDLLFVVRGLSDPCGKEVKNELEETQDRHLLAGRVYSNLDDLVEDGFVDKGKIDGRTNRYSITPKGEQRIRERYQWQLDQVEPTQL